MPCWQLPRMQSGLHRPFRSVCDLPSIQQLVMGGKGKCRGRCWGEAQLIKCTSNSQSARRSKCSVCHNQHCPGSLRHAGGPCSGSVCRGSPDATVQWAPHSRVAFPDLFLHVGLFWVHIKPGAKRPLFECGYGFTVLSCNTPTTANNVVRGVSCWPSDLSHMLILQ
jgi:hypothetical protein